MAQEGISTLPQSPENAPMPMGVQDLDATKNAVMQHFGPQAMMDYEQGMDQAAAQLNLPLDQLQLLQQTIEYILANGDNYAAVRQDLIKTAGIRPEDLPETFDKPYFMSLLVLVKEAIKRAEVGSPAQKMPAPQGFRRGGLADAAEALRQKGRNGDTILAHINPQEAALLKAMGGSGTINPATGLPEFGFLGINLGDAWNSVKQVAAPIINSPIGKIVITAGLTAALGPAGAGLMSLPAAAALSAGAVSLAGGSDLKTALTSAAIAGGTAYFLPSISKAMPGAQGSIVNSALTAGTVGTVGGLAMGQPLGSAFRTGAITGLIGGAAQGAANYYKTGQAGLMEAPSTPPTGQTPGQPTGQGTTVPDATTQAREITTQSGAVTPGQVSKGIESLGTYDYDVEAQPGGFYGGRTPTPQEYGQVQYGLATAQPTPTTSSGGIMDAVKNTGSNIFSSIKDFYVDPTTGSIKLLPTVGTVLAAGALTGQYTPTQPSPPGVVQREPSGRPTTGEDLVNRNPGQYLVAGIPGYNAPLPEPAMANLVESPAYGGFQQNYPTYAPPPQAASARPPGTGIPQPYNTEDMYNFYRPIRFAAKGGISNYYPRKNGHIEGPGTGTSDSIPAMLSDGEFVLTAKSVRALGNGSRREGAKKLYRMMHALEKKA